MVSVDTKASTNPVRVLLAFPVGGMVAASIMVTWGLLGGGSGSVGQAHFCTLWVAWTIGLLAVGGPTWLVCAFTVAVDLRTAVGVGFLLPFAFLVALGGGDLGWRVDVGILCGLLGATTTASMWAFAYLRIEAGSSRSETRARHGDGKTFPKDGLDRRPWPGVATRWPATNPSDAWPRLTRASWPARRANE